MCEGVKCAWCGAVFHPPRLGAPKKFCHVNCKAAASRDRAGAKGRERARRRNADWYAQNREYAKAKQRAYNAANPERKRQQDAKTYRKHRDKRCAAQREWSRRLKAERPGEYQQYLGCQRERMAKREAAAAISMLILPVEVKNDPERFTD